MELNRAIATLTLRLLLGIIFFLQGFHKVFNWGIQDLYEEVFYNSSFEILPRFLVRATAYYTSYVELIAGFIIIIGFKRDWGLYALASVLVIVSIGHGMIETIWDLQHVIFRTILLVSLLLLPKEWDKYSIDGILKK